MTTSRSAAQQQRQPGSRGANFEAALEQVRNAGDSAGREAFVARVLYALARVAETVDEDALTRAAGAPSDFDALLQALENPTALSALDSPLAAARLRGLRYRRHLITAEGGVISAAQVAELLGVSRQAVDKRRRAGRLLAISTGRRGFAYPAWQFDTKHGVLPGVELIFATLDEHDPWMRLSFMLNPQSGLGERTPLQTLRDGDLAAVERAAQHFGEHGAA